MRLIPPALPLAVFTVCALLSTPCEAVRIYRFVDYPDIQDGHTLEGTITVTDDAPLDSFLETDEILDWEWSVVGSQTLQARFQSDPEGNHEPTDVRGVIEVDPSGIYIPLGSDSWLSFEQITNSGRSGQLRRLGWFSGNDEFASRYSVLMLNGDVGSAAWLTTLPANLAAPGKRWLVATPIPEPASFSLIFMNLICLCFIQHKRFLRTETQ